MCVSKCVCMCAYCFSTGPEHWIPKPDGHERNTEKDYRLKETQTHSISGVGNTSANRKIY